MEKNTNGTTPTQMDTICVCECVCERCKKERKTPKAKRFPFKMSSQLDLHKHIHTESQLSETRKLGIAYRVTIYILEFIGISRSSCNITPFQIYKTS